MANAKPIGIIDLPCSDIANDKLGMKSYVNGLSQFVKKCETPMSIAIQGDWGTGKTSTLNMLLQTLEKEKNSHIKCVYFNTWQYSQFNQKDSLYLSFISNLIAACDPNHESKEFFKGFFKNLYTVLKTASVTVPVQALGIDISDLKLPSSEQYADMIKVISELKEEFGKLIRNTVRSNGRFIVFIDDLDRLNPEIAVELLEIIKLFLDVENCIFILAIDYDVVVSGVRKKYGTEISDVKCRSFFDKIIQLPFKMPTEQYKLNELVSETLTTINSAHHDAAAQFITSVLGTNPRTFKRLANSYFLLSTVYSSINEKGDNHAIDLANLAILCNLALQMGIPKLYDHIADFNDREELYNFIYEEKSEDELSEDETSLSEKTFEDGIEALKELVNAVAAGKKTSILELLNYMIETLKMTSLTEVTEEPAKRKKNPKIKIDTVKIKLADISYSSPVTSAADALAFTYTELINGDKELADKLDRKTVYFKKIIPNTNSIFRTSKEIELEKETYHLATSTDFNYKAKQVRAICNMLKENGVKFSVTWLYEEKVVLNLEN